MQTNRLIMAAILLLTAVGSWAKEKVTLPFSLQGKTEFVVGDPMTVAFQDEEDEYEVYELTSIRLGSEVE